MTTNYVFPEEHPQVFSIQRLTVSVDLGIRTEYCSFPVRVSNPVCENTCGMCSTEVRAQVDSRARLRRRPGPSCLPSGPPNHHSAQHTKDTLKNVTQWIHFWL